MKLIGAGDTVKNIFKPAFKISKVTKSSKYVDDLSEVNTKIKVLEEKLKSARLTNKIKDIRRIEKRIEKRRSVARRLGDKIDDSYKPGRITPIAIYTGNTYLTRGRADIATNKPRRIGLEGRGMVLRGDTMLVRPEADIPDNRARGEPSQGKRIDITTKALEYDRPIRRKEGIRIDAPYQIAKPTIRTNIPIDSKDESKKYKGVYPGKDMDRITIHTETDMANAVTWKQGLGYWIVYPDKTTEFSISKPVGVKEVPGPDKNKPYATVQIYQPTRKGKVTEFDADMGVQDIKVRKQGKRIVSIKFKSDRNQRTSNPVRLGYKSKKQGKIYHTKVSKGEVISRKPL